MTVNAHDTLAEVLANPIKIAYPAAGSLRLWLAVGACRLRIVPGDGPDWVAGTYYDPSGVLPLEVTNTESGVKISQRQNIAAMLRIVNAVPTFDLHLGKERAYSLLIESGASECHVELGGLPLTGLEIKQGAGKIELDFSMPNPEEMGNLRTSSGASAVEFRNLANANFAGMHIEGGAASYKLHFGGTLRRNANVWLSAAMSSVELYIPANTAAHVTSEMMLGGVETGEGIIKSGGLYLTKAASEGHTPVLTVEAGITMGSLHLHSA